MKAMAREQDRRYTTVRTLEKEINYFVESMAVQKRSRSETEDEEARSELRPSRGGWLLLGVMSTLLLGLSAALVLLKLSSDRFRLRAEAEAVAGGAVRSESRARLLEAGRELARLAIVAAAEGDLANAMMQANAAVKLLEESPWGHYAWAMIAMERGDAAMARQHLDKALAADPAHPESLQLRTNLDRPTNP
jgi:tetratricopeptide (TPR) repeat protein